VTFPALFTIESVSRIYGSHSTRHVAVDSISMQFDNSSSVGVVGESGSGKSTLARMLVGLEVPSSGRILIEDHDVATIARTRAGRVWFRQTVQLVAQDSTSSFDPRLTLRKSLRYPAQLLCDLERPAADERVDETLSALGLSPALAARLPHEVSGGQRQRFALARALIVRPRILICDEVVSALDVSVQGSVLNHLKKYGRDNNAGLLFVSHGLPATAFMARELIVMYRGRIVESGSTEETINRPKHPYTQRLLAAYRGSNPSVSAEVRGREAVEAFTDASQPSSADSA
jgi:ABC-type oligopeptide transport system ATPase subunit